MKEERLKELMNKVGLPNSQSLMIALEQVENETKQRCEARIKDLIDVCESMLKASPLWLPEHVNPHPQHIDEYKALHNLKSRIEAVLKALEEA